MRSKSVLFGCVFLSMISSCSHDAELPFSAGVGPHPTLPPPSRVSIPTVNLAKAKGWSHGETPLAAEGLTVTSYVDDLALPRWLYVLPNGDVLVAETKAPAKPDEQTGIKNWLMKKAMKDVGASGPSANRISLLRDSDGDGKVDFRSSFSNRAELAVRDGAGRH